MELCTGLSGGSNARRVAGGTAEEESGGLLKVTLRRTSTRGCFEAEATASVGRFNDDDEDDEADEVGLATTTAVGGFDNGGLEDAATPTVVDDEG